jgi:hypothetical protein
MVSFGWLNFKFHQIYTNGNKFWFFRNSQNTRNKYDKKLEWIWRPLVKRLFQISNIYIVKVYFFKTSITSTISPNFGWIRPNFGQFGPIIGKFDRFLVFRFLLYKTSFNQNSVELYRILPNFTKFDGITRVRFFCYDRILKRCSWDAIGVHEQHNQMQK